MYSQKYLTLESLHLIVLKGLMVQLPPSPYICKNVQVLNLHLMRFWYFLISPKGTSATSMKIPFSYFNSVLLAVGTASGSLPTNTVCCGGFQTRAVPTGVSCLSLSSTMIDAFKPRTFTNSPVYGSALHRFFLS